MINEIRLLSAVINEKDIAPIINGVDIDDLFFSHGDVWAAIKDYYYKNRAIIPPDLLMEKFDDFEVIETSGTVKHYLEQLRDEWKTTMLDRLARGLSKDIGIKPSDDLLNALNQYVAKINKNSHTVKDLDITDSDKAVDHYVETKQLMEERGGVLGIRSGYDSIDANYPTGFYSGQYIMVISRTNQGKSWIALDMGINAWAQGFKVLYVSLEMSPSSVRDRAYTLISRGQFGMSELSRAQIDIDEIKLWSNANFNSDNSFVVSSSDGMGDFSPAHLQAKIDQYGPDIVFVDYLQLMSDNRGSSGETERIRNVSKEIKALAMSNEIPVVAVVSASTNETKEYNSPPQIYEVASSRQAAYDADLVLALISRKQNDGSHLTEMVARKNRHGPLFDFILKMDINNGKISEEVWDESLLGDD